MSNERKSFTFEVKAAEDNTSTFEGFSAAIGNKDLGNDIIEPGAFDKTISERVAARKVKLLDNHNNRSTNDVLGTVVDAKEVEVESSSKEGPTHKLLTTFEVSSDENAQRVLQKVREGHLNELSIGFKPIRVEFEKDEDAREEDPRWAWIMGEGTRRIKELAWFETSLVLWAMNPEAQVVDSSLKRINHFAEICKRGDREIPVRYVEAAVKSLNNLISADIDFDKIEEAKKVIGKLEESTKNLEALERDSFEYLINEYKESQERPSKEHFFMWFTDQVNEKVNDGVVSFEVASTDEEIDEEVKEKDTSSEEEPDYKAILKSITEKVGEIANVLSPLTAPANTEEHDEEEKSEEEVAEGTSSGEKEEATEDASEEKDEQNEIENLKTLLDVLDTDLKFYD